MTMSIQPFTPSSAVRFGTSQQDDQKLQTLITTLAGRFSSLKAKNVQRQMSQANNSQYKITIGSEAYTFTVGQGPRLSYSLTSSKGNLSIALGSRSPQLNYTSGKTAISSKGVAAVAQTFFTNLATTCAALITSAGTSKPDELDF